MAYRFGPFVYDTARRGLMREGAEVALTHKSRELLLLFLNNAGRVLTRDEIVEHVWNEAAVTDDAIRFQIAELRRVLADGGEDYVRTIRGEGYRWETPVRSVADRPVRPAAEGAGRPVPRFRLILETREIQLLEGDNVVGRDPDAVLWIDHPSVSRRHARIVIAGGKAALEDLNSKNGTLLNGRAIRRRTALEDGDEVRIGPEMFVFRKVSPVTTRTERRE